ncbi:ExbD/TolR family protein [Agrilutibacter solisilvae]|uniref:Biopolymer transporter ExbD n=1 Tax=Agrilutibacter solisilvae TaxID=2763317 RepID=A0A975ATD0_9GAMM|nr:biopolymer transporter ExbD [Lysobacter solisilvae]QSX79163.1 biopolymer transporter ExbD [Lysobacter solisilvae]
MATSVFATGQRSEAMSQMNITPLVDVMLVLLVIFMISAPVLTGTLDMRLPQTGPERATIPPPRVTVQVQADGMFLLDGQMMGKAALAEALGDIARGAPTTIVAVKASQEAEYQSFTDALSAARRSGITNIALEN